MPIRALGFRFPDQSVTVAPVGSTSTVAVRVVRSSGSIATAAASGSCIYARYPCPRAS
ncbi:Uncharacterised protein [Mycobacterium tuberculosis]|nr:Uncharacterised protein [Mycobacterium tuberculosis]